MPTKTLVFRSVRWVQARTKMARGAVAATALCGVFGLAGCPTGSGGPTPDMNPPNPDMTQPTRFGVVRMSTAVNNGSSAVATFADTAQSGANCQHLTSGACVLFK